MTIVTSIAALDMAGVFAGRNRTIVTARAGTLHRCVVDSRDRGEVLGIVAVLTRVQRSDVRCRFAQRGGAIVAASTITCDARVIKYGT